MSDLGHLHCGQSPASSTVNTDGVGTSYVTGPEQWDGWQFHARKWTTDPKRIVPEGCIFITVKGAGVGKIFPGVAAAIGRDIYAFEPKSNVSRKFVEHALRASVDEVLRHAAGDIPGLSRAHILDHEISLPSLAEQEQVVAEIEKQFSRLDEAVAGLQRVKANLKRYKAAVLKSAVAGRLVPTEADLARREGGDFETGAKLLHRVLETRRSQWQGKGKYKEPAAPDTTDLPQLPEGWAWSVFDSVADRVTVGYVGPMKNEYIESGIPFLRSQNVRPNRFDPEGLKFISPQFHERLGKSALMPGDILVVRSGSVGVSCVVPETLGEANCSDLVIVKSPRGVLPAFGAYYLNSVVESRIAAGKVGVALVHFNTQSVAELPLPVPPLAEQHRIVAEVDRLLSIAREAEAEVDANLKRALGLRQAILSKAFQPAAVPPAPTFAKPSKPTC
jgi:type I restriction enzyme S subunit